MRRPSFAAPGSVRSRLGAVTRPLGLRIPLIMVAMLATSLATMGWLGHNRINQFAEDAERSRLASTTNGLIATFAAQLSRLRGDLATLAAGPAVRDAASPFA